MVIDTINDIIKLGNPQFGKIKMRKDEMKNNYPDISKKKKLQLVTKLTSS